MYSPISMLLMAAFHSFAGFCGYFVGKGLPGLFVVIIAPILLLVMFAESKGETFFTYWLAMSIGLYFGWQNGKGDKSENGE
ncbi:MAG: hypothetical protein R3F13_10020 [Prosthecobacter sp.]